MATILDLTITNTPADDSLFILRLDSETQDKTVSGANLKSYILDGLDPDDLDDTSTTNKFVTADDLTKLSGIESGADVTDTTNVVAALSGATLTDVGTPASTDKILLLDTSDTDNLKYAQFSTFGGGGSSETVLMTGYKSANYVSGLGFARANTVSGVAQTADTLYARPLILPVSGTFDRISVYVHTASSGHSIRLGIYEMSSGGIPSTLVLDAGTVSVATTGLKEITISQALTANKGYFLAWVTDGTPSLANQLADSTSYFNYFGSSDMTANASTSYTISHTFGALPDPYGTPTGMTGAGTNPPAVVLRSA